MTVTPQKPKRKSSKEKLSRDKEVSMAKLTDAGEALFATHGFSGTTLDMIVERSGLNRAMVYYYYKSKTGLYEAVVEKLVGEVLDYVSEQSDEGDDLEGAFRSYVQALCFSFCNRATFPAILMRDYMGGKNQERAGPFGQIIQFFRRTEALYNRGKGDGIFVEMDPHQLHLSLVGPLVFFALTQKFRANTEGKFAKDLSNPNAVSFADHHATILWKGLTVN